MNSIEEEEQKKTDEEGLSEKETILLEILMLMSINIL